MKLHARDVAAAIIGYEGGGAWHIDGLTRRVMECELSTLGMKADNPRQSLSPILNREKKYFQPSWCRGYYELRGDHVRQFPEVAQALIRYAEFRTTREREMSKDQLIDSLRQQHGEERERSRMLLTKLSEIAEICVREDQGQS